jgi:hypothetical protein
MTQQLALDLTREDFGRMAKQRHLVLAYMSDGAWRTLGDLSELTGAPEASVSARLRDLRKPQHGAHTVLRERVAPGHGLFRYKLILR